MDLNKLVDGEWYWVSHPHEGDIFYPILAAKYGYIVMDGNHMKAKKLSGLIINEAVMPKLD